MPRSLRLDDWPVELFGRCPDVSNERSAIPSRASLRGLLQKVVQGDSSSDVRAAGIPESVVRGAMRQNYKYFDCLGSFNAR